MAILSAYFNNTDEEILFDDKDQQRSDFTENNVPRKQQNKSGATICQNGKWNYWTALMLVLVLVVLCVSFGVCWHLNLPNEQNQLPKQVIFIPEQTIPAIENDTETEYRRLFVRNMTISAWNAYVQFAWGSDSLAPVTNNTFGHIFGNSSGRSILAAMSTLWIMDLKEEFEKGKQWIENELNFGNINHYVTVFQIVSEYIGGLLSCFALTGDLSFVRIAKNISIDLNQVYNGDNVFPYEYFNPATKEQSYSKPLLSYTGGQHLEYVYLSAITGDDQFRNRVTKIQNYLEAIRTFNGLYLSELNVNGSWSSDASTIDSHGREFYIHLIKSQIQSNGTDAHALEMYLNAMEAIKEARMIDKLNNGVYVARRLRNYTDPNTLESKMWYSTCYLGVMLSLGSRAIRAHLQTNSSLDFAIQQKLRQQADNHLFLAERLTETCYQASNRTKTGLGPFYFSPEKNLNGHGEFNLSPELAESYFILWRLTHQPKYREYAWQMAQAIEKYCKTNSGGYSKIVDVNKISPFLKFNQPPHFLSGTLKYLYLIFTDDSVLPLDQWVFNSVGHPLPICGHNTAYPAQLCQV